MKPTSNLSITDTALRVLILEDDPDHAFVLQQRLQRGRGDCSFLITNEEESFKGALLHFSPQLILTDNSVHAFDAVAALHAARELQPSAVCILVTSNLREEQAIHFIREGGDDCVDKIELSRLCASINVALTRRARTTGPTKTERRHTRHTELYHSYLDVSPDGLLALDDRGYIMHINEAAGRMLSGKTWAPAGNLVWDVFPAIKESFFEAAFRAVQKNEQPLTVRVYIEMSESWLDCFFQAARHGMTVVLRDVSNEEHLRAQVRELQGSFQDEVDEAVLLAQQQERHVLGQELHDNVNQLLASANLFLTMIADSPGRLEELIPYCRNSIFKAIEENRRLAHGLASIDEDIKGLLTQVEQLCLTMLRPAGILFELHTEGFNDEGLATDLKVGLYRILQEHCHNIVRHAKAGRVSLQFTMEADTLQVIVSDNGRGAHLSNNQTGVGITNMTRRAQDLGGDLRISTSPGNGFILQVRLPV